MLKLPNILLRSLPYWINLLNWYLLKLKSMEISFSKAFLILVCNLVFRNNSCGISSSWMFFLAILNVALVLFFATVLGWFSCVFVSLIVAFNCCFLYKTVTPPWENLSLAYCISILSFVLLDFVINCFSY